MRKAIPFLAPGLIIAAVALGCNSARAQNCPGNPDARVSGTSRYFLNCAHAKRRNPACLGAQGLSRRRVFRALGDSAPRLTTGLTF
jgi:hypothetical protein